MLDERVGELFVSASEAIFDRRDFFKAAVGLAAFVGGVVPSARAFGEAVDKFDIRRAISKPVDIPLFTLHMPPEFPSTWTFGFHKAPPIPADFFGMGSDPWSGPISCVGIPLNPKGDAPTADLVVRHDPVVWVANKFSKARGGPREVPANLRFRCDMKNLHERVPEPITVTYNGGKRAEKWDVIVTIAKEHPGGGYVDITWLNDKGTGGLCDIEIAVKVDFTFTRLTAEGPKERRMLTSGIEWLAETNHPWVRRAAPNVAKLVSLREDSQGSFVPATRMLGDRMVLAGACSKNEQVAHSFTLSPLETPAEFGRLAAIKQFAPRTG